MLLNFTTPTQKKNPLLLFAKEGYLKNPDGWAIFTSFEARHCQDTRDVD
jgi:hypothetical protein